MSVMTIELDATDLMMYGVEFAVREAFFRSLAATPTIKEPTDDPDDDIEAEVPDVREDEVSD